MKAGVIYTIIEVCVIGREIRLELAHIVVHEVVNVCLGKIIEEELKRWIVLEGNIKNISFYFQIDDEAFTWVLEKFPSKALESFAMRLEKSLV